ncbi:GDP-L-fucose synthase family protein [Stackebrandtia soli]|uniref:GDP-L-fucose synthase family protein n=1 Tax=Stackebrandtia soli TaxID=1892856 RepID=UPI0039E95649
MNDGFRHEIPTDAKIYVSGHRGLVGSAVWRRFEAAGFTNLIGRASAELDLTDRAAVMDFFATERPDYVVAAAAKVGGVFGNAAANADFLSENLRMQVNLLDAAARNEVKRLAFLGSSCIYPAHAEQPITEDALLTGALEPTNFGYAIAKITGVLQVKALREQYGASFISLMPSNLYGPGDNFTIPGGHALPMIMRRMHEAKAAGDETFTVYGSGEPLREYLHVDDLADAVLYCLRRYDGDTHVNIGSGADLTINELSAKIAAVVGFEGRLVNDRSKKDGVYRKLMDSGKLRALGWSPSIDLDAGLKSTYEWFLDHQDDYRR